MTKFLAVSLSLIPFLLMGQNKSENFHFGLQFKPIIAAAYFDAGDEFAQWEDYNFELSPRFGQSLGMIVRYHLSSTFSEEFLQMREAIFSQKVMSSSGSHK